MAQLCGRDFREAKNFYILVGKNVQRMRESFPSISRQKLGENINVSEWVIGNIERSVCRTDYGRLQDLAKAFELSSVDDFLKSDFEYSLPKKIILTHKEPTFSLIGKNIQFMRNFYGIKQKKFAEAIHLNRHALSNIERGKCKVGFCLLKDISLFLGLPETDLLASKELKHLIESHHQLSSITHPEYKTGQSQLTPVYHLC